VRAQREYGTALLMATHDVELVACKPWWGLRFPWACATWSWGLER
jgi:hypothetical protein